MCPFHICGVGGPYVADYPHCCMLLWGVLVCGSDFAGGVLMGSTFEANYLPA